MIKNLRHLTVIPALAALLAMGACATQEIEKLSPIKASDGSQPMFVAVKGYEMPKDFNATTKGTPATNDNIDILYKADGGLKIWTYAHLNDGSIAKYFEDVLTGWGARSTTDLWPVSATWNSGSTYYWPKTLSLDFWSIAPAGATGVTGCEVDVDNNCLKFNYTTPKSSDGKTDAIKQPDVAVSFDGGVYFGKEDHMSDGNTYGVLNFKHALSGVRFLGGVVSEGKLTYIKINNVVTGGRCKFTPPASIVWYPSNGTTSFTQEFNVDLKVCSEITKDEDYQLITDYMSGSDTVKTRTFMFVPQDVEAVTMDIEFDGVLYENVPLYKDGLPITWEPGKMYTYVLNIQGGDITVDVKEEFDKKVKKNVCVENTGDQDSYFRVAVIANWVDADGNIVAPCNWNGKGEKDGTLEGLDLNPAVPTSKWKKIDDYYYYKNGVKKRIKGTTPDLDTYFCTSNLFTSYTPPVPPQAGLDLEMIIIAQAIGFDKDNKGAKEYWGEAAAAWFSKYVEEGPDDTKTSAE